MEPDSSSKAFVYSKNVVTLSRTNLILKWPKECRKKNICRNAGLGDSVSCVSLLAHPIKNDGTMNVKRIVEIMCVDPGYTVYKSDPEGGEEWNLACTDTYDLANEITRQPVTPKYRKVKVSPVSFTNEKDAHEAVVTDLRKVLSGRKEQCDWYDNSHGIMDEFVLKTASMPCQGCEKRFSGRLFAGNIPLCKKCRPDNRFEGTAITTPKLIDLALLDKVKMTTREFTRPHMIHEEYVTFTPTEDLPFVKGNTVNDEKYTQQFLARCISVVYDIETVTVDSSLKRRIADEVVTITASLNTGTNTVKLVMFTRKIPNEWKDAVPGRGEVDANQLLGDLRKPDNTPLPQIEIVLCDSEAELVETYKNFLIEYKPHFLVSFNGHGFDHKFLVRASLSNGLKETFHGALNHFTPAVKISNVNPLTKTPSHQFMRPGGRYCKGLIPDSAMEVSYNSFPSMLSIDLFLIHDSSLNDACVAKKVEGCKLEGVSHTDIPKLYYMRHLDFFKYALVDVVITTELFWKDWFEAIGLFMELEQLVATPWNMAMSRQKTMTAQTTTYVQFNTNGFIREAKLRPKRLLGDAVIDDIAQCMGDQKRVPRLDETLQILTDFVNGNCKCNTLYKKLPKLSAEPLTEHEVNKVLTHYKTRCRKPTDPPFSTVDATMLLFYLLRGEIDWRPFNNLLAEFSSLVGGNAKKLDGLKNYILYVVRTRKCLSPFSETCDLMWKEYRKCHKPDTVVTSLLAKFIKSKHSRILASAADSVEYPRSMSPGFTAARIGQLIRAFAGPEGIKIKMLPYDGATIIFNRADINLTNPTCVLDFRSQYPNAMRAINLGIDTNVSLKKVLECVDLIAKERNIKDRKQAAKALSDDYVHVCFTREEDDGMDWTVYLDKPEYLSKNCVFFVKNVVSIQNHQFKEEIASRVQDKFKSEDQSLTPEERLKYLNKSAAKKININARYGVIQSTISPRLQPTISGVGRRSIKKVTKQLRELLGAQEIYGDTDSTFTYIADLDVFDMKDMTPEAMYGRLRFATFDVPYERFKTTVYDKYYPVDQTNPRAIREAGGGVVQELYQIVAPILSTEALELEAEKTLCPLILPSMKKYTAYNCVTHKAMTKGLSSHNKSAIAMTKNILAEFVNMACNSWNQYDLVCSLYDYLGKFVTVPIEEGMVNPVDIAKPCSISINKVKAKTKQNTLIESMKRDGVTFIFEKIRVKQVPIYPEGIDKDWSICDVLTQSCAGRIHTVKTKFDVLKEILTILKGKYSQGVCEVVEALIWGEFHPNLYTPDDFRRMSIEKPAVYKPASFGKIISKCIPRYDEPLLSTKRLPSKSEYRLVTCSSPSNISINESMSALHRTDLGSRADSRGSVANLKRHTVKSSNAADEPNHKRKRSCEVTKGPMDAFLDKNQKCGGN